VRPLHNPFSLVTMRFLTHPWARSLNPNTEQSGVKLCAKLGPRALNSLGLARMGAAKSS